MSMTKRWLEFLQDKYPDKDNDELIKQAQIVDADMDEFLASQKISDKIENDIDDKIIEDKGGYK